MDTLKEKKICLSADGIKEPELRDFFAASAMNALIIRGTLTPEMIPYVSYQYADRMMGQRNDGN